MTTNSVVVAIAMAGPTELTADDMLDILRWHLGLPDRDGATNPQVGAVVTDIVPLQLANVQLEEELGAPDAYLINVGENAMPLGAMPRHIRDGKLVLAGGEDERWVLSNCTLDVKYRDAEKGLVIQMASPLSMLRR